MFSAKSSEVFGKDHAGVVVGTVALSDICTTMIIQFIGKPILTGQQIDYLHYFLWAACCGPVIGFILTTFFPITKEDQEKANRFGWRLCNLRCFGRPAPESKSEAIPMNSSMET